MIITCPSCSTKFALPSGAVPKGGRKVKCSKCAHIWLQKSLEELSDRVPDITPPPKEKKPVPKGANLPVIKESTAAIWAMRASSIALASLIILTVCFFNYRFLPKQLAYSLAIPMRQMIGLGKTVGLGFTQMRITQGIMDGKIYVVMNGVIKNESEKKKELKHLHVNIMSKGARKMHELIPEVDIHLAPGEEAEIHQEIANISGNAQDVIIDIGSGAELWFR